MTTCPEEDRIQPKGSYVKIRYRLQTASGEYIRGAPGEGMALLDAYTGYGQLLPGLESGLLGRRAGERFRIHVPPEEAFGPYREDLVKEIGYEDFPQGLDLEAGKWVEARDETTRAAYGYFVREKGQDRVVLDYNHPLAGQELVYDLEVLEVRPATEEEKILLRPCEGAGHEPE